MTSQQLTANRKAFADALCPAWARLLRQRRDPALVLACIESALSPDGHARIGVRSQETVESEARDGS